MSVPEPELIRVVLVCAITSLRVGLRSLLANPRVEIIAEAAAPDCVGALPQQPDVLLVAVAGSLASGWLEKIEELFPVIPLLLIGAPPESPLPVSLFRTRPVSLLPLECTQAELSAALESLRLDLTTLALAFLPAYFNSPPQLVSPALTSPPDSPDALLEPLTGRELEVLQALALGLANKEISGRLGISEHTVKFHISSIYSKLGVSNRTEAAAEGLRRGLVTL